MEGWKERPANAAPLYARRPTPDSYLARAPHRGRPLGAAAPRATTAAAPGLRLALVANDLQKPRLRGLLDGYLEALRTAATIVATENTGRMIARHAPELPIKLVRSGPLGGDRQITRMIYRGHIDAVIFLVDASQRHPHQRDINRLVAAAQATQIPRAFDAEGAGLLLSDVDLFPARAPGPAAGIARWSGVERAPTSPRRPPPTCWRGA